MPLYELKIRVFPEIHSIEGRAKITIPKGVQAHIQTKGLSIRTFRINGQEYIPHEIFQDDVNADSSDTNALQEAAVTFNGDTYYIGKDPPRVIEIYYDAIFEPNHQKENTEHNETTTNNIVDESEVLLLSSYYPVLEGFSIFKLTIEIPSDFEAISEADSVTVMTDKDNKIFQFDFSHPLSGITLAAGKYWVMEEQFHGIKIKTYLFSENGKLATSYIEHTKLFIELYESMLGKYPYRTFSIVENNFQIGYSLPTYTLLGSRVIRLPFIVKTSLGHEILHQWFGNYVFMDYKGGNWSEGLTTYLSDHWYEHINGKGSKYRKKGEYRYFS